MVVRELLLRCKSILALAMLTSLVACGDDSARPEVLDKLRVLGVGALPIASAPAPAGTTQNVTLTIHAVVPLGETVTVGTFDDEKSPLMYNVPASEITVTQPQAGDYTDMDDFRLVSATATVPVPSEAVFDLFPNNDKGVRVRYGLTVIGTKKTEYVVGSFMTYKAGSSELNWQVPTVDIENPTNQEDVTIPEKGLEVVGKVTNPNDEDTKVGWFVSSGEIENRRAYTTKWRKAKDGKQALILTAHGKKSKAFTLKVIEVNVKP